jgi:hypothetical protein
MPKKEVSFRTFFGPKIPPDCFPQDDLVEERVEIVYEISAHELDILYSFLYFEHCPAITERTVGFMMSIIIIMTLSKII